MQGCRKEDELEFLIDFANVSSKILKDLRNKDKYYKMYTDSVFETIVEGGLTEQQLKELNAICDTGFTIDYRYVERINVTDYAISIFGDIVKSAYIEGKFNKNVTMEDIVSFTSEEISLTGGVSLIVEFINGKKFTIWASKWGGIRKTLEENEIV
ncbi:hypothetical protein G9F72_019235 [Clostridium estertheticum]|uniref:hypothetical protein n=1 Tax=Clostridium estertheticum TaxID=238834 RepID=UPI0013E8F5E6|nr:hypothetical protein [Clostridium estertheticum]MBZ9688467.1 hypothetical protein [Clostridium estertheticum]